MAAGLETLRLIRESDYLERIEALGSRLRTGLDVITVNGLTILPRVERGATLDGAFVRIAFRAGRFAKHDFETAAVGIGISDNLDCNWLITLPQPPVWRQRNGRLVEALPSAVAWAPITPRARRSQTDRPAARPSP